MEESRTAHDVRPDICGNIKRDDIWAVLWSENPSVSWMACHGGWSSFLPRYSNIFPKGREASGEEKLHGCHSSSRHGAIRGCEASTVSGLYDNDVCLYTCFPALAQRSHRRAYSVLDIFGDTRGGGRAHLEVWRRIQKLYGEGSKVEHRCRSV